MTNQLARIEWSADERSFVLDGVSYVVEQYLDGSEPAESFRFYKPRPMIQQYAALFSSLPVAWTPNAILELGIWHGGSIAFWTQVWRPDVVVGIDYGDSGDSTLLHSFRENHGAGTRISTHWETDQTDISTLHALMDNASGAPFDLIIDDASHKYRQTRASFDGLFPQLRPGGIYVIEDWSWSLDNEFLTANPKWREVAPLAPIIGDLSAALFEQRGVIERVAVYPDFIAIERGDVDPIRPLLGATTVTPRSPRERLVAAFNRLRGGR